jgi:hypothetical protein
VQKIGAYDKARQEVESLEELTQVMRRVSSGPTTTDSTSALEGDSDQSSRSMEEIPEAHHVSREDSILLPTQRAWLPW